MERPIIGITMGDPAGIGPEIILKALEMELIYKECRPFVIGDLKVLDFSPRIKAIKELNEAQFKQGIIEVIDLGILSSRLKVGKISKEAGRAAIEYIKEGVRLALNGQIDALVTAPISKEAINKAGFNYQGHTELLADLTGKKDVVMLFVSPSLMVALVTTHIPLSMVPLILNKERILKVIELVNRSLIFYFKKRSPKIGVTGLNPHAGEGGIFGKEEEMIKEAIREARSFGIDVDGPYPADTLFTKGNLSYYTCFVAMYHDQGLIPVKLLNLNRAVNVTLGLPFPRTCPSHGTAFDIAGKNIAKHSSMIEAIRLACRMARMKRD